MPELPEVETIKNQLNQYLKDCIVEDIIFYYSKHLSPSKQIFLSSLRYKKIISVSRRAKLLIFNLSENIHMVAHLKMTGSFLIAYDNKKISKHTHTIFKFTNGRQLHWNDIRKFGFLKLFTTKELDVWINKNNYGPEPLTSNFTYNNFLESIKRHPNKNIKSLLLDQKSVAGIGNIYAMEILWNTKTNPHKKCSEISNQKIKLIHENIKLTLQKAVKMHGTTFSDYKDTTGQYGQFQNFLNVFGKNNKPCIRCSTILLKSKIAGRGTVYCPKCQK